MVYADWTASGRAYAPVEVQRMSHVLVIPKGPYVTFAEFAEKGSPAEHSAFVKAVGEVVEKEGIGETGYRLIVNNGRDGHQDVPHVHMHVVGGASAGPMLKRQS